MISGKLVPGMTLVNARTGETEKLGKTLTVCGKKQTEAEAKQDIARQFERSEKLLQIRQKYYAEYSKFLTQNQIKRVYVLERRMMKRLANHRPARKPGQRQALQMR